MDEDMTLSLQKKAEQSRHQLSDLEEQLQRVSSSKLRKSRLQFLSASFYLPDCYCMLSPSNASHRVEEKVVDKEKMWAPEVVHPHTLIKDANVSKAFLAPVADYT